MLRAVSQQVLQEVVGFLHRLGSASKDCVVVMCQAGCHEALSKALEKHSSEPPLAPALLELLAECERFCGLYKELTGSILAGCIQVGWGGALPGPSAVPGTECPVLPARHGPAGPRGGGAGPR